MGLMEKLSVEIPADLAESVRARVQSGQYATASDAVTEALRSAYEQDQAIDTWLRNEVVPAIEEIEAGTATLLTADEVRERLGLTR